MEKEIWRPIKGYEGYYEVSSYGNVRSVNRIIAHSDGKMEHHKGKLLKCKEKNGYLLVQLCKNGKHTTFFIHRLVAQCFIPNPDSFPIINHKDEVKTNNCVDNLEWCTHRYNNCYGTVLQRRAEKHSKAVLQIDKETDEIVEEYTSMIEAARNIKSRQANISNCCRGKIKSAYGFKWRYKE